MQRPGGRNERARRSVAEAVLSLYHEGRVDFGIAEIAERAGVHRTTVYRRWPTLADLLREALTLHTSSLQFSETGDWERDLHGLAENLATFFSDPVELAMNAAMAGHADPVLSAVLQEHWLPIVAGIVELVTRASERGDIDADVNPALVVELLISPLLLRTTFLREAPAPEFVQALGDTILRATRPRAVAGRPAANKRRRQVKTPARQ